MLCWFFTLPDNSALTLKLDNNKHISYFSLLIVEIPVCIQCGREYSGYELKACHFQDIFIFLETLRKISLSLRYLAVIDAAQRYTLEP